MHCSDIDSSLTLRITFFAAVINMQFSMVYPCAITFTTYKSHINSHCRAGALLPPRIDSCTECYPNMAGAEPPPYR